MTFSGHRPENVSFSKTCYKEFGADAGNYPKLTALLKISRDMSFLSSLV